jgi:hypothetical protein
VLKEIPQFVRILWVVNTAAGVFLLVLLAARKNYRAFPAFSLYIFLNFSVGTSVLFLYRRLGFSSWSAWAITWGMQAVVIFARAVAVAEVCRHLLARYRGIWALAKRIFMACAILVLLYSSLAARHQWKLALPGAERGLELSIAAVIVMLMLFSRYYNVQTDAADRSLAVGLCLYSCFCALNDTVLERYLYQYVSLWNLLGMLAFLASLLLWTWALRKPQAEPRLEEPLLPAGVYQSMAPQINLRLRTLNEQLYKIWKPEVPGP